MDFTNNKQMFFEVTVLCAVLYNAVSKPRSFDTPLRRVLHYDGIIFFGVSGFSGSQFFSFIVV